MKTCLVYVCDCTEYAASFFGLMCRGLLYLKDCVIVWAPKLSICQDGKAYPFLERRGPHDRPICSFTYFRDVILHSPNAQSPEELHGSSISTYLPLQSGCGCKPIQYVSTFLGFQSLRPKLGAKSNCRLCARSLSSRCRHAHGLQRGAVALDISACHLAGVGSATRA